MELYVIARHGESTLNFENRINGDPGVPVSLTDKGRGESTLLGRQIAHLPLELCVHTKFARTAETAALALKGREVPVETEPLLDDIVVGDLEGSTLEEYRAWITLTAAVRRFPEASRWTTPHGATPARTASCSSARSDRSSS
jgi:broad specificity phosphatase PhoE